MSWVIEVKDELKKMVDIPKETEQYFQKKRSIYEVPASIKGLNKKAYSPQAVSFGPYHHGKEHLKPMEEYKHRTLFHFLKRCGKAIDLFVDSLAEVVQDLKDSYEPLDPVWKDDRFLKLMILDGCFMLEILRTTTDIESDYAPIDPRIFSEHGEMYVMFMPYIRRAMLLLENQLPMLVLHRTKNSSTCSFKFYLFCDPFSSMGKCLHVLDVYRKGLLHKDSGLVARKSERIKHADAGGVVEIRSATELDEARIRFKKSESNNLKDILFKGGQGVLRLPIIFVEDPTESMFLNLMAFERFHVGAGNGVTSYISFMVKIVDDERDVALLHSKGIIQNGLGSDKVVAKLFNSLSKNIAIDPKSGLDVVYGSVIEYSNKPWNAWRANLLHTYFRNPWAILSLFAAIFLFALTAVQTFWTVFDL